MKNLIPGGFPELTPDKQVIKNNLRDIIKGYFENYGYVNIETPTVEKNEILQSKGGEEVSKQIFGLNGLGRGAEDLKDYSLHFDLTVPLARYIVSNENELKFPFKRSQMQKVFRGERQQKGRFKEFMQCDIDVIDEDLDINYDIEVIEVLYKTLDELFNSLNIDKGIEVHINNRNFIESICTYYNIDGVSKKAFYKLLDSFYKITNEEFTDGLKDIVGDTFEEIGSIFKTNISDLNFEDEGLQTAVNELKIVYTSLIKKGINVKFDPYITRGLDYYTGTVFETFVTDNFDFGSICSGGRFDNLVGDIRNVTGVKGKNYGGVGGSIGLTRLFHRLMDSGFIDTNVPLVESIIFNLPSMSNDYRNKIADLLRGNNISTDVYYKNDKLGKQFSYAENKNIPFGIFAGESEESKNKVVVKNLNNRESSEVSLDELIVKLKKNLLNIL